MSEFVIIINISINISIICCDTGPSNCVSLMLRKASMMEKGQGDESKKSIAPSFPKTVVEYPKSISFRHWRLQPDLNQNGHMGCVTTRKAQQCWWQKCLNIKTFQNEQNLSYFKASTSISKRGALDGFTVTDTFGTYISTPIAVHALPTPRHLATWRDLHRPPSLCTLYLSTSTEIVAGL